MNQPQDVRLLIAEFVQLNAKLKQKPLAGADLARWQHLKQVLVQAQQVAA